MRVFINALFFLFSVAAEARKCSCASFFAAHFVFSHFKEKRIESEKERDSGPRISETELKLFGGTPTFLLSLFARLPRIYVENGMV